MTKRDRQKRKKKRKKLRWLVCCDGCGVVQQNTKAHPPPVFPLPKRPVIAESRFEQPGDWVATCRKCPSVTGVFVKAAA